MATLYEIPTSSSPQKFSISLLGRSFDLRLIYCGAVFDVDNLGGWLLDISFNNVPLISGIPLVTGIDLLGQYNYIGIGGSLGCFTEADMFVPPTFENLGTGSHLYFITFP